MICRSSNSGCATDGRPATMSGSAEATYAFDVFVSYAHLDRAAVEELVARLQRDGFRVWFDQEQMRGGHTTVRQLADGIAHSAHMIACLSDAYIDRDFTDFELQTNQSFDPANHHNRTIPAKIGPLTKKVPNQIRAFTYCDLTRPDIFEREYARITSILGRAEAKPESAPVDEETIKAKYRAAVEAAEPAVALFQARIAAEAVARFLHRRELGASPANATLDTLIDHLLNSGKLPPYVGMSLRTVKDYGNLVLREGMDSAPISRADVQPGLAALKALVEWTLGSLDTAKSLWDELPAGEHAGERLIPGSKYVLRSPQAGRNSLGILYPAQDRVLGRPAVVTLAELPQERDRSFFEEVQRFGRLDCDAIVRPLDAGVVTVGGRRLCLYVAVEAVEGAAAAELSARFGPLPAGAAARICAAVAAALETLHNHRPPVIHGDVRAENVLIAHDGSVKLSCIGRNAAAATAADDAAALAGLYARLAGGGERTEAVAACSTVPEMSGLLEETASGAAPPLAVMVECFREHKPLPAPAQDEGAPAAVAIESPVEAAAGEFGRIAEFEGECRGAWPLGADRLVVWGRADNTLAIVNSRGVVWRDSRPVHVRCVARGPRNQLAVGSWDGQLRCFAGDCPPASVQMHGAVGDVQYSAGRWIAGTWRHSLAAIHPDARIEPLPPQIEHGVMRIATMEGADRFAVADLAGGIALYAGRSRVAALAPLDAPIEGMAFCGNRLVVLTGTSLVWVDLNGKAQPPHRAPGNGRASLVPGAMGNGCLLLLEDGSSWLLAANGAHLPYHVFPKQRLLSTCGVAKRFTARAEGGGCEYWRGGAEPAAAWPDALEVELSLDGTLVAVRYRDRVELYQDPL